MYEYDSQLVQCSFFCDRLPYRDSCIVSRSVIVQHALLGEVGNGSEKSICS